MSSWRVGVFPFSAFEEGEGGTHFPDFPKRGCSATTCEAGAAAEEEDDADDACIV